MTQPSPDELKQMLSCYSGRFVHVCLPGGNVGDKLIYVGLRTLLAEYNISFSEFQLGQEMSGTTLFVAGCGGYCRFWNGAIINLPLYLKSFKKIFILPSTFDNQYEPTRDFLENLPKNVEVFCRERTSYEFASRLLPGRAYLAKDTAFYAPWENYRNKGSGILYAFRIDKESAHRVKIPKENIDISLEVNNCDKMLKKISLYEHVHTDRAHVAIAAAMLGKKTTIYDCGYFKLRAIYDYSLAHLPDTVFCNNLPKKTYRLNYYIHKFKKGIRAKKKARVKIPPLIADNLEAVKT